MASRVWDPWLLSSPRYTLTSREPDPSQRPPAVTGLKSGSESVTRTRCGHPGQSPKVRTTGERDVKNWTSITGVCPTVGPKKTHTGGMEKQLPTRSRPFWHLKTGQSTNTQDCRPKNLPHSQNRDREKGTSPADTTPNQVKTNSLTRNPQPRSTRLPTQVSMGVIALQYPNGTAKVPDLRYWITKTATSRSNGFKKLQVSDT